MRKIFLLVFISTLSIAVFAQKSLNQIVKSGVLRVGMTGNQPPYNMKSNSGAIIGFEVDMAQVMTENMGVKLEVVEMPFKELIPALEEGRIDIIMSGMDITIERNMKMLFSTPYSVSGKSFLTSELSLSILSNTDVANNDKFTIAALAGSTSENFVKQSLPEVNLLSVSNYQEAVQKIGRGEVDALLADYPACIVSMYKYPEFSLATLDQPLTLDPIGVGIKAGDLQFLNLIDNYITTLELSGILELLEQKWFDNGDWINQIKK